MVFKEGKLDARIKAIFLLSHHPNPRMIKRIKSLSKISNDISLVFWDRFFNLPIPRRIRTRPIKCLNSRNVLSRILIDLKLFFISFEHLLIEKPVVIYISGIDMLPAGYFYKIFHRNVKLVLEIADLPGGCFSKREAIKYINNLINKMIKKVDLLVLTSPYFWDKYYKDRFSYPQRVFIMENLPLRALFKKFKPEQHKELAIGFVGFIRYVKQIEMLFESCKDLENKTKIIVSGGGPDYEYIKRISKNYKNVKVTGPYNYAKDIVNIYSKIDIVYSVYDANLFNARIAIPNRFYEAIACGLPIIVAKNTALSNLVKKYGIGFEVSHSDVKELGELIKTILRNPLSLKKCRENILKISKNFYYEDMEEKFIGRIVKLVRYDE